MVRSDNMADEIKNVEETPENEGASATEIKEEKTAGKKRGMTVPNILTLFRIFLIPVFIICYYIFLEHDSYIFSYNGGGLTVGALVLAIIFAAASVTDFFDGKIARKHNLVTTFGKFADPLADKMLVFAAMTVFLVTNVNGLPNGPLIPVWVYVIMLIREFMVSGIRMLAAQRGEVIAAGMLGKIKTFVTMIALFICFFFGIHKSVLYIGQILIYISCILTILSGAEYLWKSRKIVFESI